MSITIRWDTPDKTLLIVTCKGKWPSHDLTERLDQAWADASTAAHRVYAILDFRFAARLPADSALALVLALNAMPNNMALTVLLGVTSPLFSAASSVRSLGSRSRTLYAASMQEAHSLIAQHQRDTTVSVAPHKPDQTQVVNETGDPKWFPLLKPFALVPNLTLTTYEGNGTPVSSAVLFVLQATRLYVLSAANTAEVARLYNNPYVKIMLSDPSMVRSPSLLAERGLGGEVNPARIDLVAQATAIPLDERPALSTTWQHKYNQDLARMNGQPLVWLDLQPLRLAL